MALATISTSQARFYKDFLMARHSFEPREFGVDMEKPEFIDLMVEEFIGAYRTWTIDELLLHPREALRFCDDVRHKHGYFDLPDDIILRVILQRRKTPTG